MNEKIKCKVCGNALECVQCMRIKGGSKKVPKGFSSRAVLNKALATRKANKLRRDFEKSGDTK